MDTRLNQIKGNRMFNITKCNNAYIMESMESFQKSKEETPLASIQVNVTYVIKGLTFHMCKEKATGRLPIYTLSYKEHCDYARQHNYPVTDTKEGIKTLIEEINRTDGILAEVDGKAMTSTEAFLSPTEEGTLEYESYLLAKATFDNNPKPFLHELVHREGELPEDYNEALLYKHSGEFIEWDEDHEFSQSNIRNIVASDIAHSLLVVYDDLRHGRQLQDISDTAAYLKHMQEVSNHPEKLDKMLSHMILCHQLWDKLSVSEIASVIGVLPTGERNEVNIASIDEVKRGSIITEIVNIIKDDELSEGEQVDDIQRLIDKNLSFVPEEIKNVLEILQGYIRLPIDKCTDNDTLVLCESLVEIYRGETIP